MDWVRRALTEPTCGSLPQLLGENRVGPFWERFTEQLSKSKEAHLGESAGCMRFEAWVCGKELERTQSCVILPALIMIKWAIGRSLNLFGECLFLFTRPACKLR